MPKLTSIYFSMLFFSVLFSHGFVSAKIFYNDLTNDSPSDPFFNKFQEYYETQDDPNDTIETFNANLKRDFNDIPELELKVNESDFGGFNSDDETDNVPLVNINDFEKDKLNEINILDTFDKSNNAKQTKTQTDDEVVKVDRNIIENVHSEKTKREINRHIHNNEDLKVNITEKPVLDCKFIIEKHLEKNVVLEPEFIGPRLPSYYDQTPENESLENNYNDHNSINNNSFTNETNKHDYLKGIEKVTNRTRRDIKHIIEDEMKNKKQTKRKQLVKYNSILHQEKSNTDKRKFVKYNSIVHPKKPNTSLAKIYKSNRIIPGQFSINYPVTGLSIDPKALYKSNNFNRKNVIPKVKTILTNNDSNNRITNNYVDNHVADTGTLKKINDDYKTPEDQTHNDNDKSFEDNQSDYDHEYTRSIEKYDENMMPNIKIIDKDDRTLENVEDDGADSETNENNDDGITPVPINNGEEDKTIKDINNLVIQTANAIIKDSYNKTLVIIEDGPKLTQKSNGDGGGGDGDKKLKFITIGVDHTEEITKNDDDKNPEIVKNDYYYTSLEEIKHHNEHKTQDDLKKNNNQKSEFYIKKYDVNRTQKPTTNHFGHKTLKDINHANSHKISVTKHKNKYRISVATQKNDNYKTSKAIIENIHANLLEAIKNDITYKNVVVTNNYRTRKSTKDYEDYKLTVPIKKYDDYQTPEVIKNNYDYKSAGDHNDDNDYNGAKSNKNVDDYKIPGPIQKYDKKTISETKTNVDYGSNNDLRSNNRSTTYQEIRDPHQHVISKCYVCGLEEEGIPFHTFCAFKNKSPGSFKKKCLYSNIDNFQRSNHHPDSVLGRWTGGCSFRWIDLNGVYTQRSCRNRYQPTVGRSYTSKRMAILEDALGSVDAGCIESPMTSLVPFSRQLSLYARFHACVCPEDYCNSNSIFKPNFKLIILPFITIFAMIYFI